MHKNEPKGILIFEIFLFFTIEAIPKQDANKLDNKKINKTS